MGGLQFLVIFGLALLTVLAAWTALAPAGPRARIVKRALHALKKDVKSGPRRHDIPSLKLNPNATRLDIFTSRILPNPEHWRRQLERTGTGWGLGVFGAIAVLIAAGSGITLAAMGMPALVCWGGGAVAGFYAPRLILHWAIARRSRRFVAVLPDAIALMVRGVRSGLPLTEGLINVGREMEGPVGEEFRKVSDQLQLGRPLEEAMWEAAGRIELPEFTFMCIAFAIQRETGGNLAETLENLEQLLRRRKQMALKVRAFSAEARTSSGIIGSLPFIMMTLLSVVDWDYIQTLFYSHSGHMLLAAGGACLLTGLVALVKLSKFDI